MNHRLKHKFFFLLCLCMQFAGLARAGVSTAMPDYVYVGQTFKDWSYDFMDNGDLQLAGRIYLPTGYNQADTTKKYPLVVFYHGNGLGGGDNTTQVSSAGEIGNLRAAAETRDFILYLPQTIPVNNGWYQPGGAYLDMSMLQIANLQSAYNIDREKLYLTGFSMGGNATWSMAGIHAGAIAAIFPVDPNPGGVADSNAVQLLTKGVWGFCNHDEAYPSVLNDIHRRMNQLRALDGKTAWTWPAVDISYAEDLLRYTEPLVGTPPGHHANWAYLKPELYSWLLAQKNTTGWLRTGEKICFDFGNQQVASATGTDTGVGTPTVVQTYTRPDSAGVAWNSSAANYGNNFGAAIAFAKTTTGRSTLASLYVLGKFTDYNRTAATQTLFDANIGLDGWVTPASATGTIQLQGLTPGGAYKVELFATTEQTGGAYTTTAYTIGAAVRTLTVLNNQAAKATFDSVTADANGRITMSVSGTSGSTCGMLATMELTALNTGAMAAPALMNVVSRKTHGSKDWDLAIYNNWQPLSGLEVRRSAVSGSNQWIYSFDQPVTGGTVSVTGGIATVNSISFSGNQMTVSLSNVSDVQYVTLAFSNIQGIGSTLSGTSVFGSLCGDVDRNLLVDDVDLALLVSASGQTVTNQNFIYDLNCDGAINASDISLLCTQFNNKLLGDNVASTDITTTGTVFGTINPPTGGGNKLIATICDGVWPAVGSANSSQQYDTVSNVLPRIPVQCYGYIFPKNKIFTSLVFQEGKHFNDGGWWRDGSLKAQVLQDGVWVDAPATVNPAYPIGNTQTAFGDNYETYTFTFTPPVSGSGIQITGTVGGSTQFTSIGELRAWASILPPRPVITGTLAAMSAINTAFSYQIAATNTPLVFVASGFPAGLSFNPLTGLLSGTPTQSGTFNAPLRASNAGGSGTATLAITIQNTMDAWKSRHFSPAELSDNGISGDTACPAGDKIPNLMKYALNQDPKRNGTKGLPTAAPMTTGSGNYLTLTYKQILVPMDLAYTVEVSGDLQTWSSGTGFTAPVNVADDDNGETQTVIVQDLTPMNDASRRFIRLKVTKP